MDAPLSVGAVHETLRLWFHTVTVGAPGASGSSAGVLVAVSDQLPVPERLTAATRTW